MVCVPTKIISKCELVKLCHINRGGPVLKTHCSNVHYIVWLTDWLTDWLYLHNQTLQINSEIENYNVQDCTERNELTNSCPKDKYKFKLRITNNTNSKNNNERLEIH